jgi:hypothetical protein
MILLFFSFWEGGRECGLRINYWSHEIKDYYDLFILIPLVESMLVNV